MATSAVVSFFLTPGTPNTEYVVLVQNTSAAPFSIYSLMIGAQYLVGLVPPGPLADIQPVSAPPGWTMIVSTSYGFLAGQTNFQGDAASSGYIDPGATGVFVFQSSTNPPPASLVFGCGFWDGANEWGFVFNGQAEQVDCVPVSRLPCFWRPPVCHQPPRKHTAVHGRGTKTVKLTPPDGGPSVTMTYDRLGNIVRLVQEPME